MKLKLEKKLKIEEIENWKNWKLKKLKIEKIENWRKKKRVNGKGNGTIFF